ncbi:uncharacterized protein LOC136089099 [Hydra vulgaris]|uniref:Uncharacterized protein LOC136089099 n=1 Tax=Hydra vulgaris TaxID=6087 RepID=A0ABM4D988_HYDVU
MSTHCAVEDCKNGQYRLIKWRQEICKVHGTRREEENCNCTESFSLQSFPERIKNPEKIKLWKLLINREKDKKLRSPGSKSRVYSNHFVSGYWDYPTLDLGYDSTKRISNLVAQDSPCWM